MLNAPKFPKGRKVNVSWTAPDGRRHMGTCWWYQVQGLLDDRVRVGSTDIVARCDNGRRVALGDKT